MNDRTPGRATAVTTLIVASVVLVLGHRVLTNAFYPVDDITGWLLFVGVIALSGFGIRKKISFLPVGSAASWLRVHVVVGVLCGLVYVLHTGGRMPTGVPDQLLAATFAIAFFSGIVGLALSRAVPRLLAGRGPDVIFEQIPERVRALQLEIEQLAVGEENNDSDQCPVLVETYSRDIQPFFVQPRNRVTHLLQLGGPRLKLIRKLESQRPFLANDDRPKLDAIVQRVTAKDDLDYHFVHQGLLKLWLFIHIPATAALLVFALLHIALVTAFVG